MYVCVEDIVHYCECENHSQKESEDSLIEDELLDSSSDLFEDNCVIEQESENRSFFHGVILNLQKEMAMMVSELAEPENLNDFESFKGVICDTGANRFSVMSLFQYKA